MNYQKCPSCNRKECFACEEGHCVVLIDNDFDYRECPFYKTKEQVAEEREYCRNRVAELNKNMEESLC